MSRPNIIYLHSHDTGRYVEPYGYAIRTPNLQRLAEQGMLFRQAHNAAPTCSPSRAALLTGMCPHSAGQFGLVNRGFDLADPSRHLVRTLRAAGYHTALAGVQHVRRDPRTIGYHQILETGGRKAREVAPAAAEFLGAAPAQPFFLTVGFSETHREFPPPAPADDARYLRPPAPLPDTPQTRTDMAAYQASVTALDQGIGLVLGALQEAGLADDTLVICTTDHGLPFPRMKCNLTDHGTGVMLILRGPGGFGGGRVSDALVSQIDLFPTLCELLAIAPPAWLQGRSLLPLVRGETEEINDAVFAEVNYHGQYEPQRMIRTRRWKYIRRYLDRRVPSLANCDNSLSKELLLRRGWADLPMAEEQLYDLVFDPNEAANLAGDARHADTLAEMRERLTRWMEETDDPILNGPIPEPQGATVSRPDDVDPKALWAYTERPPDFA